MRQRIMIRSLTIPLSELIAAPSSEIAFTEHVRAGLVLGVKDPLIRNFSPQAELPRRPRSSRGVAKDASRFRPDAAPP
jgi:hypothetical protein